MQHNGRNNDSGFTLAELVVATTLISIVMLGVYTTFHSTILHWRNGSENERTFADARRIFAILEHDLGGVPTDDTGVDAREYFWGDESRFELITVIQPMNLEERAMQSTMQVSYRLSKNMLIREERALEGPLLAGAGYGSEIHRERLEFGKAFESIIADDVIDFRMTYLWTPAALGNGDSERTWVSLIERPVSEYRLPDGVSVEIVLHDPAKDPAAPGTRFTKTFVFDGRSSVPAIESDDETGEFSDAA